jgi:hypothetical protein
MPSFFKASEYDLPMTKRRLAISLLALVLVVALGVGIWVGLFTHKKSNSVKQFNPSQNEFLYSNFLPAKLSFSGYPSLTILRPSLFKPKGDNQFLQFSGQARVGQIFASAQPLKKNDSNLIFKAAQIFANSNQPPGYQTVKLSEAISIGDFKEIGFSLEPLGHTLTSNLPEDKTLVGKIIALPRGKVLYLIAIEALVKNWNSNSIAWQRIISSVKAR